MIYLKKQCNAGSLPHKDQQTTLLRVEYQQLEQPQTSSSDIFWIALPGRRHYNNEQGNENLSGT